MKHNQLGLTGDFSAELPSAVAKRMKDLRSLQERREEFVSNATRFNGENGILLYNNPIENISV